ncbi:YbhB/YbcL family Raf kinase inhibitor-like protein [Nocardia sp. NBC_00511]|uniref:YbhB/YbcL family Raf kinase inhibitor-like protein n=1 Tax=Nocardia sp. NBC_00511 TaxID=2903591 RepID=UPI0030E110C4
MFRGVEGAGEVAVAGAAVVLEGLVFGGEGAGAGGAAVGRGVVAVVTGIPPTTTALAESALDATTDHREIRIGTGAFGRRGYAGPRPIPGHGPHRYVFQLFALDRPAGLGPDATLAGVLKAIDGHVLARGKLTGSYER